MEQCRTQVFSRRSHKMAEAFIKAFTCDYAGINPTPDAETVMAQLPIWLEHYNNLHSHKDLGSLSARIPEPKCSNSKISGS
ncbi:hypothetical protein Brsp04_02822 [Brucella sp. NBRC 12952]